jgi:hypothetical protein
VNQMNSLDQQLVDQQLRIELAESIERDNQNNIVFDVSFTIIGLLVLIQFIWVPLLLLLGVEVNAESMGVCPA